MGCLLGRMHKITYECCHADALAQMMASLLVCTVLTFTRPLGKRAFGFFGLSILSYFSKRLNVLQAWQSLRLRLLHTSAWRVIWARRRSSYALNYFRLTAELRCFPSQAEFPHTGFAHLYDGPADQAYRAIYYARYIDWVSLFSTDLSSY